jgi:hypothetical protein
MVDWSKYPSLLAGPDVRPIPREVEEFEKEFGPLATSLGELCRLMTEEQPDEEHYSNDKKAELVVKIWASAKRLRTDIVIITLPKSLIEEFLPKLYFIFLEQDTEGFVINKDKWKVVKKKCNDLGGRLETELTRFLCRWTIQPTEEQFAWMRKAYEPLAEDLSQLADRLRNIDRWVKDILCGYSRKSLFEYFREEYLCEFDLLIGNARASAKYLLELLIKSAGSEMTAKIFLNSINNSLQDYIFSIHDPVKYPVKLDMLHGSADNLDRWYKKLIESEKSLSSKTKRSIACFPMSHDAKWKDVHIEFLSKDKIRVRVGKEKREYHMSQIGFANDKDPEKPTKGWKILQFLAMNRDLSSDSRVSRSDFSKSDISKLRKNLSEFFGLGNKKKQKKGRGTESDPIPWVLIGETRRKGYQPRFLLTVSHPHVFDE